MSESKKQPKHGKRKQDPTDEQGEVVAEVPDEELEEAAGGVAGIGGGYSIGTAGGGDAWNPDWTGFSVPG